MNTIFGGPGELPVDIRQNLVRATYALSETSSADELKAERERLTGKLAGEIEKSIRARFFHGFHKDAPRVVRYLVENSQKVPSWQRFAATDLVQNVGISEEAALAVMEDLVRYGLAEEAGHAGSGFMIRCLLSFYAHFDPLFMDWNADQDAATLARELVKREQERVDQLSQELDWAPRRINPAVFRLLQGFAHASDEVPGASPFYRVELSANVSTRALADGRESLPPVAPRAQFRLR